MRRLAILAVMVLSASAALAQPPHHEWRTIETVHFRVHHPIEYEAWARHAATRLESVRSRVIIEVGFEAKEKVDVLVMDPVGLANGAAFPFLGWPRMVLFTNPPPPESSIGSNRDWIEMLTVHEEAHLIHILRPSRNPLRRALSSMLPLGPIAFTPRWVTEGYATVIEGDLTGSGRPHGDFRAAVLRRWAQLGRLPSYSQLHSDRRSWMGMSMAYLGGSAYLEWLRDQGGSDSLRHLWRRATARTGRSFTDAFEGVYGDSPGHLYGRFSAELTQKAMEVEEAVNPSLREGELWQDLTRTTDSPDVSPDGKQIVTVLRSLTRPARMVIWSTEPDEEAERQWQEKVRTTLEKDPEDVAPVRTKPLPRKPLHEWSGRSGAEPVSPRWMPDGKSVLFVRFDPDSEGVFRSDVHLWLPQEGRSRRLTGREDVRDADPSPDGKSAVAVRNRHGFSQLVRVDLETGEVDELTPAAIEPVHSSPRWSPDGSRIAWVSQREGAWRLMVRDLSSGEERELESMQETIVAQPEWSGDGRSIYAVVGQRGFIEIHRYDANEGNRVQITRSHGASLAPASTPDDSALFFLSLDVDGLDIRRLDLTRPLDPLPPIRIDARLSPAVPPPTPPRAPPFDVVDAGPSRPYGAGRQESLTLFGGNYTPSNRNMEIGLRLGDVVGRLDTIFVGALGDDGSERGAAVATSWRGWPVEVRGHLFRSDHDATRQPKRGAEDALVDLERTGGEIAAGWNRYARGLVVRLDGGLLFQRIEPGEGASFDQRILFTGGRYRWSSTLGALRFEQATSIRVEAGSTEDDDWRRGNISLTAGVGTRSNRLRYTLDRTTTRSAEHAIDDLSLGGTNSSIVPFSAISNRIIAPALPIGTRSGDEYRGDHLVITTAAFPLDLFYSRHDLWTRNEPRAETLDLAGVEARVAIEPFPIARIPAVELRFGAARILDDPFKGDEVFWLNMVWRP
ncbi:MAG TPA: hypothetical protein VMT00_11035 [Thermoanaerobaculia bacterium]|nr:hypothetical protein [Thermoanaerobaculia bacterium]